MYIPKNRNEPYTVLAVYLSYCPDLSTYEFFASQEDAEETLYQAIDNVFLDPSETHSRMKDAADAAFLACRQGRKEDARDRFGVIMTSCREAHGS